MSPSLRLQPLRLCPVRFLPVRRQDLIFCRRFSRPLMQHLLRQLRRTVSLSLRQMERGLFHCLTPFRPSGSRQPPDLLIHSHADPRQGSPGDEFGIALVSPAFFVYRRSVICLTQGNSRQRVLSSDPDERTGH